MNLNSSVPYFNLQHRQTGVMDSVSAHITAHDVYIYTFGTCKIREIPGSHKNEQVAAWRDCL